MVTEQGKKVVLVVDDETELVEMLNMRLEAAGYEVVNAYDGLEGLRLAREKKPDLILLDIMMPGMYGDQVCRMLKFDKAFKDVPIIMLTARGTEDDKKIGAEVGADGYITKPFEGSELLKYMERLLNSKRV